ncbi:CHASE domain-containing protein [Massilia sp. 9096]|uniref:CHASE domain-containing protein n=1 Tax=Massilia sp. 9096 TaxID=1500894 RepID=UPI00068F9DE2|nr:CHASE domain-containing protein [Massilia sp. 9096]
MQSSHRHAQHRPAVIPLVLAALVFLAVLIVTYAVAESARRATRTDLEDDFDYRARDFSSAIVRRMNVYEEVLEATRGFLRGSPEVSNADFADYFTLLRLKERFPGIEALGIAAIAPSGPHDVKTTVTHILPLDERNRRALGYDMFSEPVRRAAMEAARDSGRAAATGKVTLVQEGARTGAAAPSGFLLYVPVYRSGAPRESVEGRRTAILGWVYSPFRMDNLMRGLGGEQAGDLEIELYDGAAAAEGALLYRSSNVRAPGSRHHFKYDATIDTAGRHWLLRVRSSARFESTLGKRHTLAIALTGLGLGLLLSLVVWLLATERRRALQLADAMTLELRVSRDRIDAERERIRLILQNAYHAFVGVDPAGRITDWNRQACKLFGWRDEEALGRDALELLLPQAQRDDLRACLLRLADGGRCEMLAGPTEMTLLERHGEEIPVEIAITAQNTPQGFAITAFVRDIRPRKQAEERERQRQQRLDEARAALVRSQKLEAVGHMTGGVAHDFNNILHIISANVQLMLRNEEGVRKRLLSIMDAVERGKKLTGQLLAFARRQPLHPSVVRLTDMIERMDSLLHRAAGDAVEIRFAIPSEPWNALVDPNQLENVLLNLVINARDAMEHGGAITIALANLTVAPGDAMADTGVRPGEFVTVAVSDTGSGMPPEVMERAFEPFFTTKPEGKGTGLGLSMAHGFVKQSGGHIRLSSTPDKGTTVTLFLPRARQDTPDPVFAPVPH